VLIGLIAVMQRPLLGQAAGLTLVIGIGSQYRRAKNGGGKSIYYSRTGLIDDMSLLATQN